MTLTLQGLRTVIYPAPDLDAAKAWWTASLGVEPYFDQPFYVGYSVAGYELGLLPDADPADGTLVYWGVQDVAGAVREAIAGGATEHTPASDVGDRIVTATVRTPHGALLGLVHNPHPAAMTSPRPRQAVGYRTLQDLPGVGPSIAGDYARLGITEPHQLATADSQELFDRLELIDGPTDRCVLYVFRCAHYAVNTPEPDPRLLDWWAWKRDHDDGNNRSVAGSVAGTLSS